MRKNYYAIYDNLGQTFNVPVLFDNDATATRWFTNVVNSKENDIIYSNPQDFDLYKLGSYENNTGELTPGFEKLISGKSVKKGE